MLQSGGLVGDFDVAQLMVILFVLFFVGLVLHLRQEDKREGYPLKDPAGGPDQQGFPPIPSPKTFLLMDGGSTTAPHLEVERPIAARRFPNVPGSPLIPTGDPLADGVGPASYALRKTTPLIYEVGKIQVLPLRSLPDWGLAYADQDPRGLRVISADNVDVGVVVDLWIDRSVKILRYLEVEVKLAVGTRRSLLPIYYTDIKARKGVVKVSAIRSLQFAEVPRTIAPDTITAREEDQVNAFYAGAKFFRGFPTPTVAS
jgi:photosynthetic reaction center H subunit